MLQSPTTMMPKTETLQIPAERLKEYNELFLRFINGKTWKVSGLSINLTCKKAILDFSQTHGLSTNDTSRLLKAHEDLMETYQEIDKGIAKWKEATTVLGRIIALNRLRNLSFELDAERNKVGVILQKATKTSQKTTLITPLSLPIAENNSFPDQKELIEGFISYVKAGYFNSGNNIVQRFFHFLIAVSSDPIFDPSLSLKAQIFMEEFGGLLYAKQMAKSAPTSFMNIGTVYGPFSNHTFIAGLSSAELELQSEISGLLTSYDLSKRPKKVKDPAKVEAIKAKLLEGLKKDLESSETIKLNL